MRLRRLAALIPFALLVGSVLAASPARDAVSEFRRRFAPGMNALTRTGALETIAKVAHAEVQPALLWAYGLTVRVVKTRRAEKDEEAKKLEKLETQLADISQRAIDRARKAGEPPPEKISVPATLLQAAQHSRARVEQLQKEIDAEFGIRDRLADAYGTWLGVLPDELATRALIAIERKGLGSRDPDERLFTLRALGAAAIAGARRLLMDRLAIEKDRRLIPAVVDALARQAGDDAIEILMLPLIDERWQVRAAAVASLARIGSPDAIQPLIDQLRKEEGRLRGDIALALRILTDENLGPNPDRWQTWWDANREGFVPPRDRKPPEDVAPEGEGETGGERGEPTGKPAPPAEPPRDRPSFYGIEILSKRVVFVIDVSGSMNQPATSYESDRTKIEVARRELRNAVLALPEDAHFNIISYHAEVAVWRKGMIPCKRANRLAAVKHVDRMTADGGTNIHDALKQAFEIAGRGARDKQYELGADTIFFLSDGVPTRGDIIDPDQILAEVKRWNLLRRVKIHAVGVGKDHAEGFMKALAETSGGAYVRR